MCSDSQRARRAIQTIRAMAAAALPVLLAIAPLSRSQAPPMRCSLPLEGPSLSLGEEWPAFSPGATDAYCYDHHGLGYGVNQTYLACEGCLVYQCMSRPGDDWSGSHSRQWWSLSSVGAQCCVDNMGQVLPPNKGFSTQLNNTCETVETTTCITAANFTGSLQVSVTHNACCLDSLGGCLVGEGSVSLRPSACSSHTCKRGSPAVWTRDLLHMGSGCCEVNSSLVAPGEVLLLEGGEVKCCSGDLVTDLSTTTAAPLGTKTPPTCQIEDVAYLIDTSGSMANNESVMIWKPLALGLLAELKDFGADIKNYTMLNYLTKVEVVLKTDSNDEMSKAVDTLPSQEEFGKGSNELTFSGLKKALEQAKMHNFICLFSDEAGDDVGNLTLKQDIIDLKVKTKSKIFLFLRAIDEQTLQTMKDNFEDIGEVFDIENQTQNHTLTLVMNALKESEICFHSNTTTTTNPATATTTSASTTTKTSSTTTPTTTTTSSTTPPTTTTTSTTTTPNTTTTSSTTTTTTTTTSYTTTPTTPITSTITTTSTTPSARR